MLLIICPDCGYKAPLREYGPSCADECTCPACELFFTIQWDFPGEDEDGDDFWDADD